MICNLPYVKKIELSGLWDGGHVKINRIDKVDNVGAYVIKYMVADMDDTRLMGEHAYLRSRRLDEPIEYKTWQGDREAWQTLHNALEGMTASYATTYESEQAGKILYRQYNTNRQGAQQEPNGNDYN